MSGSSTTDGHGLTGIADAEAFLARLTRLDPRAVVRLRATNTPGRTTLWARLPWAVLVGRTVDGAGPGDATVSAAALLAELSAGGARLPERRDAEWRHPLPPSAGRRVEALPVAEVRRLAAAAAGTLRAAAAQGIGGRAVGSRALRDALLDHVAVVVTGSEPDEGMTGRVEVSQRLVQAVVRMGFLGAPPEHGGDDDRPKPHELVHVRHVAQWVGLSAPYGIAWLRNVEQLALKPLSIPPNG
ncbi:MAG TPA: hypothetical protein VFX61_06965 [Micromonosporaceae bacterium]|nr:hypothetical protein [Micromonosporaceae bacterium]